MTSYTELLQQEGGMTKKVNVSNYNSANFRIIETGNCRNDYNNDRCNIC